MPCMQCTGLLPGRLAAVWLLACPGTQVCTALVKAAWDCHAHVLGLTAACAAVVERVGWTNGSHSHKIQEQSFIVSNFLDVVAMLLAVGAAVLGLLALLVLQSVKAFRRWTSQRRVKGSKQL